MRVSVQKKNKENKNTIEKFSNGGKIFSGIMTTLIVILSISVCIYSIYCVFKGSGKRNWLAALVNFLFPGLGGIISRFMIDDGFSGVMTWVLLLIPCCYVPPFSFLSSLFILNNKKFCS